MFKDFLINSEEFIEVLETTVLFNQKNEKKYDLFL